MAKRIENRAITIAVAKKAEITDARRAAAQLQKSLDSLLDQVAEVENEKVDALRQMYLILNAAVESGKGMDSLVAFLKQGDMAAINQKAAEKAIAKAKRQVKKVSK